MTLNLTACAYHFGLTERALPGGYTQVDIPVFKNKSADVGIEPLFTDALIRRFERAQSAKVSRSASAPVVLEGTIVRIDTIQDAAVNQAGQATLPNGASLVTEYRLVVLANVVLRRKSDDRIVWQGSFSGEKVYLPPRIGVALVNSADSTYNQSARIHTIGQIAETMMLEAHDRITENY